MRTKLDDLPDKELKDILKQILDKLPAEICFHKCDACSRYVVSFDTHHYHCPHCFTVCEYTRYGDCNSAP